VKYGIPRVILSAAKDEVIPIKILTSVHKKYITPHIAIIVYAALGFLFATFGGFKQLAILSSAALLIIYLGVALAVIKLRINEKKETKSETFRIPGGYVVPIISTLIILYFLFNLTKNEMFTTGIFIGIISMIYLVILKINRHNKTL
jgi:basic amino acid/polyamine antiporter, APA family